MIQTIKPKTLYNQFARNEVKQDSEVLIFKENRIFCHLEGETISYPKYYEIDCSNRTTQFLFAIDDVDYFLLTTEEEVALEGFSYENVMALRTSRPKEVAYAGLVGYHLYTWYRDTVFCGRCSAKLEQDEKERMMKCPVCGNTIYPKIAPAIIVAVTDGDKILLTKYAGREYSNYALIAGFAEIGETIEETVEREVLEEVGLKVKNITYYKSQPWAYSASLLMGFFAELDGKAEITLEEEELSEGTWFQREEIELEEDDISLTREMIMKFKQNQ